MSRFLKRILTQSFPGNREAPRELDPEQEAPAADDRFESRAFAIWWEHVANQGAQRVLDVGMLRPGSLRFFAEQGVDLGVLGAEPETLLESMEDFTGADAFGGALLWDLPNYLEEPDLVALGAWLEQRLAPGAPVYLALATRTPYAARPRHYEIVDAGHLRVAADPTVGDREVIISGPKLDRLWAAFEVDRSFLLRNGSQEYVWRRV